MQGGEAAALTILVVDDHAIMREGLERILLEAAEGWHVLSCSNGFDALKILDGRPVDLAIVDLTMPGMRGLDLIKRIRSEHPQVAVLVLTMHTEHQYALRAFRAGAKGYLTKDRAAHELVAAVRKLAGGGAYVASGLAESVILQLHGGDAARSHDRLSDREMEVMQRLIAGERLTDIADGLHLSVKTVSTHKARILDKLQLPSLAALVRYGLEHGLTTEPLEGAAEAPPPQGP